MNAEYIAKRSERVAELLVDDWLWNVWKAANVDRAAVRMRWILLVGSVWRRVACWIVRGFWDWRNQDSIGTVELKVLCR